MAVEMIQIDRSRPQVVVDSRRIPLTKSEYALIVALGMMDNRVASPDLLMDVILARPVRIPADQSALWRQIAKLRKKIGAETIVCKRKYGYMITGPVVFQ